MRQQIVMTPLFKKLNFKQHKEVFILNRPSEFVAEMEAMKSYTTIKEDINSISSIQFVLAFVKSKSEVDTLIPLIDKKLEGDGTVWMAYPKGTSKKYRAEINRDNGWEMLGAYGFEAVRQVAIDEDWSALRFRKVEFIKTMKRRPDSAMTKEGKVRTKNASR